MAASRCSSSSASTQRCTSGFSVIEMLVVLTVIGLIAGATLTVTLSSQRVFETDRNRTAVNQNLRSGMDLLGIDIRQAGERLPGDMPAIMIIDGPFGQPDQLVLRRNLLDPVLPVCKDISAGSSADAIFVAVPAAAGTVPPGCAVVDDTNGDGWPDNMEEWLDYRLAEGGEIEAYVFNPVTGNGEFFLYDAEDSSTFHLHKANGDAWQYDYPSDEGARVYMLDQYTFRVVNDVLQYYEKTDSANPLNLVSHIYNMQARAHMRNGTVQDTLSNTDDWAMLRSIEIILEGGSTFSDRKLERTVRSHFFPRNVLSISQPALTALQFEGGGHAGTGGDTSSNSGKGKAKGS